MNRRHRHRGQLTFALATTIALLVAIAPTIVLSKPAKPQTHKVTIKGMKFTPANLTIKAGDSVTWENADDRDHTVDAADNSFNSGNIGPNGTFSFTFNKSGKFAYNCGLHPRMRGQVVVQ
jgi:plastocyanin